MEAVCSSENVGIHVLCDRMSLPRKPQSGYYSVCKKILYLLSIEDYNFMLFQGVMSHAINWELLCSQYFADDVYREEITKLVRVDKVIL
jgi:hypothetical protein